MLKSNFKTGAKMAPFMLPGAVLAGLLVFHISSCMNTDTEATDVSILPSALPSPVPYHSPIAIVTSANDSELYMAEYDQHLIRVVDPTTLETLRTVQTRAYPSGLVRNHDGNSFYMTAGCPNGSLIKYDAQLNVIKEVLCGHSPTAPAVSPDGKLIAVCDRFKDRILFYDDQLTFKGETKVVREPVSVVFDLTGSKLYVANALPDGPANGDETQAKISVIDVASLKLLTNIKLLNGSINLRQMALSPDGDYVIVPFVSARYQVPTTRIDRAWLAANSICLINTATDTLYTSLPVDDPQLGFTNPSCAAFTPDGKTLCILGAGAHEMITMPYDKLIEKIKDRFAEINSPRRGKIKPPSLPEDDLGFIRDIRSRRKLDLLAPRTMTFIGNTIYVPGYYSDSLNKIVLSKSIEIPPKSKLYGVPFAELPLGRRGELYFSDGRLCLQQWLSCITCHPDGRADALNWDLVNDGIGNPKNSHSMLYSIYTPPAMATGIRPDAEYAIRSGVTHIQFHYLPPAEEKEVYPAIEQYYREMKPIPSPWLTSDGKLTPSAERGKIVFEEKAGCAVCHNGAYLTNMQLYDVGTTIGMDKGRPLDTPSMNELWRTAPYMHDGRTSSLREVITTHNPFKRGNTKDLTDKEFEDLLQYLLSL